MTEGVSANPPPQSARTATLSGWALVAAFAVLIAFAGFVFYMVTQRTSADITWSRLAWLFSSVEAIAFAAAGAVFGSSIQRQRAEKAEAAADRNAGAAARGHALAAAIKAEDPATVPVRGGLESSGPNPGATETASSVAARHAAIARQLFPDSPV